jgi:membrane peptidoglycan carboxypeptidase
MRRWLRRCLVGVCALIALVVLAGGILLAVTPSVGNAWSVARTEASSHGAAFPGPPVPHKFSAALIATEDHRFTSEPGIDPYAILRVLWAWTTGSKGDQGGATLYQQLAKLLYTPGQTGAKVELKQVALAVKLKYSFSDEQILRMYAGVAYFGHGYYGLAQASCGYYGRMPDKLSWPQAALLAGLVQAPSVYDPLLNPALARWREKHVFSRLVATGTITQAQSNAALAVPIARLTRGAGGCRAS